MKVITIKNWRRPDYYRQVLDALQRCDGIAGYRIIDCVDAGYPQAVARIRALDREHPLAAQIVTHVADSPLGCAGNTRRSLELGFREDTDFVIHLEDDTVPARDFLRFMEWSAASFRDDPDAFVVVGYNRLTEVPADFAQALTRVGKRLSPVTYWGWGLWRRIWDEVKDDWFGIHWAWNLFGVRIRRFREPRRIPYGEAFLEMVRKSDDGSWGWPMRNYFPRGRKEVFPHISRCQNIGADGGRFNPSAAWHAEHIHTPVWAAEQPPVDYLFVPAPD